MIEGERLFTYFKTFQREILERLQITQPLPTLIDDGRDGTPSRDVTPSRGSSHSAAGGPDLDG